MDITFTDYATHQAEIDYIRSQVFHQEQQIDPALDLDGLDAETPQVLAYDQGQPVGTARLRFNADHTQVKLERVAVLSMYRRQGIGRAMVNAILVHLHQQHIQTVVLHAQRSSEAFYRHLGFIIQGLPFLEAGIEHIEMGLRLGTYQLANINRQQSDEL